MVTIQLHSGESFVLPREFITTYLPGSVFASALELDPMAEVIPITQPVITPQVMEVLVGLSQGKEPAHHVHELAAADRYLNVPGLQYYADPAYELVSGEPVAHFPQIVPRIIKAKSPWVYAYVMMKGYQPTYSDLIRATELGADEIVKLIMARTQFKPEPDRRALTERMLKNLTNRFTHASDRVPKYIDIDDYEDRINFDDIRSHLDLAQELAKGDFGAAYEAYQHFDTFLRDTTPEEVFEVLTAMFENPNDFRIDWNVVRGIRWFPPLPTEPYELPNLQRPIDFKQ